MVNYLDAYKYYTVYVSKKFYTEAIVTSRVILFGNACRMNFNLNWNYIELSHSF